MITHNKLFNNKIFNNRFFCKKNIISLSKVILLFAYFIIFLFLTLGIISQLCLKISKVFAINTFSFSMLALSNAILYTLSFMLPLVLLYIAGAINNNIINKNNVIINMNKNTKKRNYHILVVNLIISIIVSLVFEPIGMGLSGIGTIIFDSNTVYESTRNLVYDNTNIVFIAAIISIFPAILEELIYRKVIYSFAKKYYSNKYAALISALCFGTMHLNLQQFIYAFIFGLIACKIYDKSKNIINTMVIHFIINFTQLLSLFYVIKENGAIAQSEKIDIVSTIFGFVISIFILILPFIKPLKALINKYKSDLVIDHLDNK